MRFLHKKTINIEGGVEERLPYYLTSRCWKTDLLRFPGKLTFWDQKQKRFMWEERKRLKRMIFYVLSGSRKRKLFFSHSKLLLSCIQLFCDPMDCSPPGSSVYGIPPARYWSRLPFPSAEDIPNLKTEPISIALAGGFFTSEPPWKLPQ